MRVPQRVRLALSLCLLAGVLACEALDDPAPDPVDAEYTPQTAAPAVVIPGGLPRG